MFGRKKVNEIDIKMRLYGFSSIYGNYFSRNKNEIDRYVNDKKENGSVDVFFGTRFIIDYIDEYADRKDVISVRKNKNKAEIITIIDDNSYELYNKNKWIKYDGDVSYIYDEFAKRGINFEKYEYFPDKTLVKKR